MMNDHLQFRKERGLANSFAPSTNKTVQDTLLNQRALKEEEIHSKELWKYYPVGWTGLSKDGSKLISIERMGGFDVKNEKCVKLSKDFDMWERRTVDNTEHTSTLKYL